MPALALTDLANLFGLVKFYTAARARGRQADRRLRRLDRATTASATSRSRLLLLCGHARRLPAPVRLLSRAYRTQPASRPRARFDARGSTKGTDGLIALSGARDGDVGQALLQGNARGARSGSRATGRALSRSRFYLEVQRAGHADDEAHVQRDRARSPASSALPVVATHPVQFLEPRRLPGARGARLHRRRRHARRPAAAAALHARAVFQDAGGDGGAVRRPAAGARQQRSRSRSAATSTLELGKNHLPRFPDARRRDARRVPARRRRTRASSSGWRSSIPTPASASAQRAATTSSGSSSRSTTILKMGFPGYFLIVADFINWAKSNGVPVGPGPRLGRRLAGRLLARHHRPRSAALQPAVRALPESRARVDARLRHRLLPGQPRPRHRLREAEVRRATRCRRSPPSARWRRRRRCATSAACSTWATRSATSIAS